MNFDRFVQEYSYTQLGLLKMIAQNPASFRNSGILRRVLSYFKNYILVNFESIQDYKFGDLGQTEAIFLCVNNENEAVNLYGLLADVPNIDIHSCGRYNPITKKYNTIPGYWLIISLLISPILLMYYICKYRKLDHLKYSADRLLIGFAYYKYFKARLKKNKLSKIRILISNHNNPVSDALLQAASCYPGIETYYIEHCPLIANWPPIKVDYLVIATDLSIQRKDEMWTNDKLLFIPNAKYKSFSRIPNDTIGIGIAISPNDDILYIKDALRFLRGNFKEPIVVRCHPELGDSCDKILKDLDLDINIMNPVNYSVVDFLSSIRILIVSDSGIFFDAWSAGVMPIKVRFGGICSEYTVKDSVLNGVHVFDDKLIKVINKYIFEDNSTNIRSSFTEYMSIKHPNLREFNLAML